MPSLVPSLHQLLGIEAAFETPCEAKASHGFSISTCDEDTYPVFLAAVVRVRQNAYN